MKRYIACLIAAVVSIGGAFCLAGAAAEAQPRGKAVYDARCVECHGSTGKGDGPSAAYLVPRPRDFTAGKYKIRSTESGTMPTDDDLMGSVRRGLYGTAMPGWDRILADGDITEVVQYLKSLSPQFAAVRPKPVAIGDGLPSSPASISRGQQVYDKLQCGKCHGSDGRGRGAVTHLRGRLTHAAARRGPHRTVDVPWRRHLARHLPAIPHRHDRHADAVVRGQRVGRGDVGPRELRRLAGAKAGVVDDR